MQNTEVSQHHLDRLSKPLARILEAELKLGNKVVETGEGWPTKGVIVFLGQPFNAEYKIDGLEFREINDPHYWKWEYFDASAQDVLACKYGQ